MGSLADLMNAIFDCKDSLTDEVYKQLIELTGKAHAEAEKSKKEADKKLKEVKKSATGFENVQPYGLVAMGVGQWDKENCRPYMLEILEPRMIMDSAPDAVHYSFSGEKKQLIYMKKKLVVWLPYKYYKFHICKYNTINANASGLYENNIDKTRKNAYCLAAEYPVISAKQLTAQQYETWKELYGESDDEWELKDLDDSDDSDEE